MSADSIPDAEIQDALWMESEKAVLKMKLFRALLHQLDAAGLPWFAFRGGVIPDYLVRVHHRHGVH